MKNFNDSNSSRKWQIAGIGVLAVLIACGLVSCHKVADVAFEARCHMSLGPATVEVTTDPVDFTVDNHYSTGQISAMYPPQYAGVVLGITKANLTKELTFDNTGFKQPGSGRLCTRPHVKVHLSFSPMQVLIGSDFPPNSCKYKEIYLHEMRHVKAYTEYLPGVATDVQEQLLEALGQDVHYFKDDADATKTLETLLNSMWMPYLTSKLEQVEQEQVKIDTFAEYERLSRTCQ
jgi:hypothetical protein